MGLYVFQYKISFKEGNKEEVLAKLDKNIESFSWPVDTTHLNEEDQEKVSRFKDTAEGVLNYPRLQRAWRIVYNTKRPWEITRTQMVKRVSRILGKEETIELDNTNIKECLNKLKELLEGAFEKGNCLQTDNGLVLIASEIENNTGDYFSLDYLACLPVLGLLDLEVSEEVQDKVPRSWL